MIIVERHNTSMTAIVRTDEKKKITQLEAFMKYDTSIEYKGTTDGISIYKMPEHYVFIQLRLPIKG